MLPEVSFNQSKFLKKVKDTVKKHGFCVIVASEGIKNAKGKFLAESDSKDAFGHSQLGGVAPRLADLVNNKLKLKNHWAVADYLQRSASHLSSGIDRAHAVVPITFNIVGIGRRSGTTLNLSSASGFVTQ